MKIQLCFALALLSAQVFAATSSSLSLPDQQVRPGQMIAIKTDKLYSAMKYTVTCNIKNENPTAEEKSAVNVSYYYSNDGYIDSKSIPMGKSSDVAYFNSKGSRLLINNVRRSDGEHIIITNLDFTDSYFLSSCKATLTA